MTLNVAKTSMKLILCYQIIWCGILLCIVASWFYQGYLNTAYALLCVTAAYLALSFLNHKMKNQLFWLCLIPAAVTIFATTPLLASLWYYLGIGMLAKPMGVNFVGAVGIMFMNSIIGIVLPSFICCELLRVRRNTL